MGGVEGGGSQNGMVYDGGRGRVGMCRGRELGCAGGSGTGLENFANPECSFSRPLCPIVLPWSDVPDLEKNQFRTEFGVGSSVQQEILSFISSGH